MLGERAIKMCRSPFCFYSWNISLYFGAMDQLLADDFLIKLIEKRKECLQKVYSEYMAAIARIESKEKVLMGKSYSEFGRELERRGEIKRRREEAQEREEERRREERAREGERMQGKAGRRQGDAKRRVAVKGSSKKNVKNSDRRASMVLHLGDASFSFGSKEPEQVGGQKQVGPKVMQVISQIHRLFKQLE
jgi:hypothetical protein